MLKSLASKYWPMVLLAILIVAVFCTSRYAENRKENSQANVQASSPKASISPSDAGKSAQNAYKPEHYPSWADTFTWPEGATVWALFLTLMVIAWQSTETRDAAKAALVSADAARKSADAFMEGDRAWVTASIHQPTLQDMNIRDKTENWGLAGLIFKNLGKTPSTITDSYVRYDFVPSISPDSFPILPKLPPEPDYGVEKERAVIAAPGTVWMPRQKFDFCIVILKHDFREHLKQWEVSEKILCVYGFIDYIDAYKRPHTTRFCYAYLRIRAPLALMNEASGNLLFPPKFCLSGPEPYNRIT